MSAVGEKHLAVVVEEGEEDTVKIWSKEHDGTLSMEARLDFTRRLSIGDFMEIRLRGKKIVHTRSMAQHADIRFRSNGSFEMQTPVIFPSVEDARRIPEGLTRCWSSMFGFFRVNSCFGRCFDKMGASTEKAYNLWATWYSAFGGFVIYEQEIVEYFNSLKPDHYSEMYNSSPWGSGRQQNLSNTQSSRIESKGKGAHDGWMKAVAWKCREGGAIFDVFLLGEEGGFRSLTLDLREAFIRGRHPTVAAFLRVRIDTFRDAVTECAVEPCENTFLMKNRGSEANVQLKGVLCDEKEGKWLLNPRFGRIYDVNNLIEKGGYSWAQKGELSVECRRVQHDRKWMWVVYDVLEGKPLSRYQWRPPSKKQLVTVPEKQSETRNERDLLRRLLSMMERSPSMATEIDSLDESFQNDLLALRL